MTRCIAAVMQMCSTDDVHANLKLVEQALPNLKEQGVQLLTLPECFTLMPRTNAQRQAAAEALGEGMVQEKLARWAKDYELWIVAGTIPIRSDDPNRFYATALVYSDAGEQVAHYHKLHLFDADFAAVSGSVVGGKHESFQESAYTVGGSNFSPIDTPWGALGVNICYDLRFPELTRALAGQQGEAPLDLLVVPSAFAITTGKAHWEILLRARAIENQCYVLAPAQCGQHNPKRSSYGHSLMIDPWGKILKAAKDEPEILVAELSSQALEKVRRSLPALAHRKIAMNAKIT